MTSLPSTAQRILESGDPTQPTLVLIHGLGTGAWVWRPQLPLLGEHYHTLALDLPGFGTAANDGSFSLERAAQAVVDLVRTNGNGRAHICGLSLGAMVALRAYQTAPDRVSSLILSGGQVHLNRLHAFARRVIVSLLPERTVAGSVLQEVRHERPELVAEATVSARQLSKRNVLLAMQAQATSDFRPLLSRIAVPTLVLCGANDRPNLPASRLMGATIPQAELHIIPGAGHIWNLEQPDHFGRTVLTFAERVDARYGMTPG